MYVLVTFALIPFAYVISCLDKLNSNNSILSFKDKLINVYIFIPFGIPILVLDAVADIFYFWWNNFRRELKKIIIVKE